MHSKLTPTRHHAAFWPGHPRVEEGYAVGSKLNAVWVDLTARGGKIVEAVCSPACLLFPLTGKKAGRNKRMWRYVVNTWTDDLDPIWLGWVMFCWGSVW